MQETPTPNPSSQTHDADAHPPSETVGTPSASPVIEETEDHPHAEIVEITPTSPHFQKVYDFLNDYFGPKNEFEPIELIRKRFAQNENPPEGGPYRIKYFMTAIMSGDQIIGARDHVVIVPDDTTQPAVLHLLCARVAENLQGNGYGTTLRDIIPANDAAKFIRSISTADKREMLTIAEMEPPDDNDEENKKRRTIYGHHGFLTPSREFEIPYMQPNLTHEVETSPVPLMLVVKQGRLKAGSHVKAKSIKEAVKAIYEAYGRVLPGDVMAPCYASLNAYPADEVDIALTDPSTL